MSYQAGPAEVPGGDRVFKVKANVDLTRYQVVIQSDAGANEVMSPAAAGDPAWGFAQEAVDYSEGQHHVVVRTLGFSKAIAFDGNIVAGSFLQVGDTSGRVAVASTSDYVIARACEASATQGDIIVVQVLCGGFKTAAS